MADKKDRRERSAETYEGPSAGGRRRPDRTNANPAGAGYDKKNDGPDRPSV